MVFTFEFLKSYGLPVYIFISIVAIFLLWGGITFLNARGDPQKKQKGKRILVSALSGLFLISIIVVAVNLANDFIKKEGIFQQEETEFAEEFPPAPSINKNFPPAP
jgi:hypothetical protein